MGNKANESERLREDEKKPLQSPLNSLTTIDYGRRETPKTLGLRLLGKRSRRYLIRFYRIVRAVIYLFSFFVRLFVWIFFFSIKCAPIGATPRDYRCACTVRHRQPNIYPHKILEIFHYDQLGETRRYIR